MKIDVFSQKGTDGAKAISNCIESFGHKSDVLYPDDMLFSSIKEYSVTNDMDALVNWKIITGDDMKYLTHMKLAENNVPIINPPEAMMIAIDKSATASLLSKNSIPTPDFTYSSNEDMFPEFEDKMVFKPNMDNGGSGVKIVESASEIDNGGLIQPYLEMKDNQFDVRVAVVGDNVVSSYKRVSPQNDFRTNGSIGGTSEEYEPSEDMKQLAVDATKTVGLDCAGIDIMSVQDSMYVIEVNTPFYLTGVWKANQHNVGADIARLALEKIGCGVSDEKVEEERKSSFP